MSPATALGSGAGGGSPQASLLFVHAHPDDESLTTGLAMAHYARAGHPVHLLTCTLGEEGEVIPPELAHLAAGRDDALGPYRSAELDAAMAVLGVRHEVLGARPGDGVLSRYRDSGMAGTASAAHPDALVNADPSQVAAAVAEVILRVRPAVVVSYDEHGGYGHPDHIATHRATVAAVASLPSESRPPLFAVLTPRSWAREDRLWLADRTLPAWTLPDPDGDYPPSVVDDGLVTHELVRPELVDVQADALRCHRTQVTVAPDGLSYALSNGIAARLPGREGYARLDLGTGRPIGPFGGSRRAGLLELPGPLEPSTAGQSTGPVQ